MTVAQYILQCLKKHGCHHIFGVPGTSCAGIYFAVDNDPEMKYLVTVNELEAGYIADGYGRFAPMSAVAVSYGVGNLSMINAIASAYTEKVPMIVLNGGPTANEQADQDDYGILFSHSTGKRNADLEIYKNVTVAADMLTDLSTAQALISGLFKKASETPGPVYLEVANNFWDKEIEVVEEEPAKEEIIANEDVLKAFFERISVAKEPVILLGSEICRRGLAKQALAVIEKLKIPFCTTLLSKSVIDEGHELFIGTYDSDLVNKPPRRYAEASDCFIALGCIFGIDHGSLVKTQYKTMVDVSYGKARIASTAFEGVVLKGFLEGILSHKQAQLLIVNRSKRIDNQKLMRKPTERPTHDGVFKAINKFLSDKGDQMLMVADTCLSSYPASDLQMPATKMFLANPVWLSIGQGTPASIGAHLATGKRPIIVSGDGGFQMIAQTFSTMVKYKIPSIIAVIDNGLYGIEQFLLDKKFYTDPSTPSIGFNTLNRWKYENFPEVFGGGKGFRVNDTDKFYETLELAFAYKDGPVIIAIEINPKDIPTEYVKKIESLNL
ncbi:MULTISPECIES: thiamine pyrophosphate-binding protein [unclassified Mucilaginibacter]|uniref:thiamine pyrophosphate-binding protein n=1 Tax=unclassified Mucilaginibacter TaxID=2617802 RepID=UPI002AC94C40|nr:MULTISPECIES: thiamine pyrophosphate-binding protein [unclassified Mucilaginibacter]MEB0260965.1 thiamine pyrophosphate-binding protein [Mucilaginibacter sp. 10I4]MEB0279560.1 thiamine pyrophosphate-binding protein [Mucilaginibacter sp. 10B2]MEB0302039.1 thiamine pyrophosphate-binding protein [Mucilaginibacter sp. 5C4]WPX22572.1 thiamine pyrophosphate-binding protein [Mucilaginibacter sp. 5C4]